MSDTNETVTKTPAQLMAELMAMMKPSEMLSAMAEIQLAEKARVEAEIKARAQRIIERKFTLDQALQSVSESIASFNAENGTQLFVKFDGETKAYVVADAPAVQSKRGKAAANAVLTTVHALTAGRGTRQRCQLDTTPFAAGLGHIGSIFGSYAECARAAGLDADQIAKYGGGHAGRAMEAAGIKFSLVS